MLTTLGEKIHDNRFLRLLRNMLQAGYLEDWTWNATLSGAPQGGLVSPILSNIYLHRLDQFVEKVLIPEYTRGVRRAINPAYHRVQKEIGHARASGDRERTRQLRKQLRSLPSKKPHDPAYRRLRYARYADDTLLGFTGPKAEAEQIKQRLAVFLRDDLALNLSEEKTLITHGRTGAARYLGYEITVHHDDHKLTHGRRSANGSVALRVPRDVINDKCAPYLKLGKPEIRRALVNDDDHTIVATYGSAYRGLVNYYLLAGDVWRLSRVHWVMATSMLKTLACKHRSTVSKTAARYQATTQTPHGPRKCFQARVERAGRKPLIATFGGLPLKRQRNAVITDHESARATHRKELITRLRAERCEMCERTGEVQVHHVGKLAHLGKPGQPRPAWAELMARKRRKTLVVCAPCHDTIHAPTATTTQ